MVNSTFSQHRSAMLERWIEGILSGYPDEAARFLASKEDPFANPVGEGLRAEVGRLLDAVIDEGDPDTLLESLDRVIRVRAVQDFTPAGAVGFLLDLKPLAREFVNEEDRAALAQFDSGVDRVLLAAFDVYSRCREQMFEIRVDAIKRQSITVIERLNAWRAERAPDEREPEAETPDSNSPEEIVPSS